jgi:hypothetical protein
MTTETVIRAIRILIAQHTGDELFLLEKLVEESAKWEVKLVDMIKVIKKIYGASLGWEEKLVDRALLFKGLVDLAPELEERAEELREIKEGYREDEPALTQVKIEEFWRSRIKEEDIEDE